MRYLQDGVIQEFPRHLVPALAEIVRARFRTDVHGVSFDPWDNVMVGTSEGLILGGARELEAMFPEPGSVLDTMLIIDEMDDAWDLQAELEMPIRQATWDELRKTTRRPDYRSWKVRRDTRYHTAARSRF